MNTMNVQQDVCGRKYAQRMKDFIHKNGFPYF